MRLNKNAIVKSKNVIVLLFFIKYCLIKFYKLYYDITSYLSKSFYEQALKIKCIHSRLPFYVCFMFYATWRVIGTGNVNTLRAKVKPTNLASIFSLEIYMMEN